MFFPALNQGEMALMNSFVFLFIATKEGSGKVEFEEIDADLAAISGGACLCFSPAAAMLTSCVTLAPWATKPG